MRTRNIFRYLIAIIIALGTTVNAMAQERNLKIYFNQYTEGATAPIMLVTDDNNAYDIPAGVTVSAEGVAWAKESRFFGGLTQGVNDRLLADYIRDGKGNYYKDEKGNIYKKESHLKLTFTNFPYEVNMIQWNKMNDLFSGFSWSDLIMNYNIATKCVPVSGNGFSSSEEHWAMNVFTHNASFSKKDIPWQDGETLNGLTSFEINEGYDAKIGIGRLTFIDLGKKELSNKCRTFIKAGWNGSTTNSNITDGDDSNWAFKVKFTLPDIRMRSYVYNNKTQKIGQQDDYIFKGEKRVHALRGYISAHQGAVEPTFDPADQSNFHFEYFADLTQMDIARYSGIINEAKVAGEIPVTVVLMRGPKREVCRYVQKIIVNEVVDLAQKAEICIGFVDGKKGYDLTLTEKNAQIKGFITKPAKDKDGNNIDINPIENASGYHFEYSESSEGEIITIDPLTGKITPKKEGDVQITAILKYGNNIYSDPFTYTLHVFGKAEGVDVNKRQGLNTPAELIYHYSTNATYTSWGSTYYSNPDNWKASELYSSSYASYDWKANTYLRPSTSILENSGSPSGAGQDGWKEIAWYKTSSAKYWRAIAQKICFDIRMPKYSTVEINFSFAGNLNIGTAKGTNCQYGFEVLNLGNYKNKDVTKTNKAFNDITWNTTTTGENIKSASYTSLAQSAIINSGGYVGDGSNVHWAYDDITQSDFGDHRYYTHYLAVMAYIYRNGSYSSEFSVGYKGIPTYKYYTKVIYAKNDGTGAIVSTESNWKTSTSKTETFKLFQDATNPEKASLTRTGYEFLGWSTDPNATTPEYTKEDQFPIYDSNNGGGWGPVTLYAVWKPNKYIVELKHLSTGPVNGYVEATYDQALPSVDVEGNPVVVPVRKGWDFKGYYGEKSGGGNKYYNADMTSNHIWDRTDENYVIASWSLHQTTVILDLQGGIRDYGATEVTATYAKDMPTVGLYQGQSQNVSAPRRDGYTFGGYYNEPNGAGTQYYTASMTSASTWNIDERLLNPQVEKVTLYAYWIPNTYTVTLNPQGGTGGSTSVTAAYGQPLPNGLTAPTKEGYEFKGYYSNANQEYKESTGENYGGKQYYDKDMVGVADWDYTYSGVTLYAHWAPKKFVVSFDGTNGAIVPNQMQYDSNKDISEVIYNSDGVLKISFKYGGQCPNKITNGKFKKAAFKLLGFYDSNDVLVASVEVDHPEDRDIYFNENSGYWTRKDGNFVWNCAHDVDLTARYVPKYTVRDGDIIDFGTEYLEVGIDWENSMVHDLLGAAEAEKEAGRISSTNPVMVFDIRNANYLDYSSKNSANLMVPLRDKDFISPNLLVYLGEGAYNVIENEIKTDGTCPGLVVTDRFPIKIPTAFTASKASYARDAKVAADDPAKDQAKNSSWGTLCLPYPIENDMETNHVKFYELKSMTNNYMEFSEMAQGAVIPANTPVLYNRTDGDVGSEVRIENWNVVVPMNADYTPVFKSYSDADESIRDWEFRGNLKTTVFYGKGYVGLPSGAQILPGDVYYFKQNKFTYLNPDMDKNGKHYNAAMMTLYPYRAYFYRNTGGSYYSSTKVSAYSILVVGEDGTTLDITNAILGDGEGDGKIYDLNGIRVMQPVKGRLYIVNGQKKVYR